MSKRFVAALMLAFVLPLAAQEKNRWEFFQALDWPSRADYLNKTPGMATDGPFQLQALGLADDARIESGTTNEVAVKVAVTVQLIQWLKVTNPPGTLAALQKIPVQYRTPMLRGEAWLALATLGDKTQIPALIRALNVTNESSQRSRGEEVQATYLLQSLGLLKASEAFRTAVAASLGWYTPVSGVRALARKTLPDLVPDVEAAELQLLANDDDLVLREGLFQAIADRGDAALNARAAAALLSTLVRIQPRDKADQDLIERLTLAALASGQRAGAPPVSLVPSLKVLVQRSDNFQWMVQSVRLLGRINDPAAVDLLTRTLAGYNTRQKSGTNQSADLAMVKELFQALAQTGQKDARVALDDALYSGYTPALVRDAQDALAKLPQ